MQPYNSENGILLSFAIVPISVRTVAVDYHITSYKLPSFKAKIDKLEILPFFTDIISRHCSQEIREIIPVPLRRVRTTRSSTHSYPVQVHCLIHELYLTNHHSFKEHAIYGTSTLLLAFLNPTTCHLSNLRSISLYLFPSLSLWVLYRLPWPLLNITQ